MFTCQTQSVSCVPRCNETTAGAYVMINALLQTSVNSRNILMTWILRGWCLRPTLLMTKITLSRRNLSPPSSPTPSHQFLTRVECAVLPLPSPSFITYRNTYFPFWNELLNFALKFSCDFSPLLSGLRSGWRQRGGGNFWISILSSHSFR